MDSHWPDWTQDAACIEVGTAAFYPEDEPRNQGDWLTPRRVCRGCMVRFDCLDYVMSRELGKDYKTRFGVLAGMSPLERHKHEKEWLAKQEGDAA